MSLKVGILMGGPSEERNVSLASGEAVSDACKSLGYKTTEFPFENNYQKLIHNLKNQDINSWLVKNGYALAYTKYSKK